MANNISSFTKCANCGACINICPKDAIALDTSGDFYRYTVDPEKCVDCGACVKVCPENQPIPHLNLKAAYGGWHKDKEVVKTSSSGGAFTAIANYVLSKGGTVYGAAYTDDCKEVICRSTEDTDLDNIKRSKYVESTVGLAFREIKAKLESGSYVLFCGTPCQVAGLMRYLRKDYDRLLTVDFACGGLSSHRLYQAHLANLEKKYASPVSAVNFRSGLYGWKEYGLKVDFQNGKSYQTPAELDPYVHSFMFSRCAIRENCLACQFRDTHYSDFIIADYWRWFEYSHLSNDETGISLILTNSDKAESIMEHIGQQMYLEKQDLNKARYNCYVKPPATETLLKKRKRFWEDYESAGLKNASIRAGMLSGMRAWLHRVRITQTKGKRTK